MSTNDTIPAPPPSGANRETVVMGTVPREVHTNAHTLPIRAVCVSTGNVLLDLDELDFDTEDGQ